MQNLRTHKKAYMEVRSKIMLFGFFSLFFIVIVKLFQIQVLNHNRYKEMAENQYWTLQELPARRGNIVTADGYVLAGTQDDYLLYLEPKVVKDKYKLAHELGALLADYDKIETARKEKVKDAKKDSDAADEQETDKPLAEEFVNYEQKILDGLNSNLYWYPVRKNLSPEQMEEVRSKGFEGVGFEKEPQRYYPEGTLASHVLGFVGSDDKGDKLGYFGIEGALNDDLKGRPGKILEETDATGNPILAGGYRKIDPIAGRDVVLTVNRAIQYLVEKALKDGVKKYDAISGTVVVMDPFDGSVLAMANYPTYDPADFAEEAVLEKGSEFRRTVERQNIAVAQTYEPGSVIKPLTVSSAVDLNLVNANSTFEDSGPVNYSGFFINTWDGSHYGTQTIVQLLQKSNNIGAAWVGTKVGADRLSEYFKDFGLGSKTGIDLEGEDTGIIRDPKDWTAIDTATASFGQSISATPLQVLNAFNVIANGGTLYQPKIISKIIDGNKVIEIPPRKIRTVISKATSDQMIPMLELAADGGEAKFFVLKDYKVAGKTGTAQIAENGKYAAEKTNATFVGFLSGEKKISIIVKLQEPHSSIYAAETAAPLWMQITSGIAKYYGITPDKNVTEIDASASNPATLPVSN